MELTNYQGQSKKLKNFAQWLNLTISVAIAFWAPEADITRLSAKAVECTCKGGEKGLVCYHAAAALSLHVGLARQRVIA
jgi:hypothetical protein